MNPRFLLSLIHIFTKKFYPERVSVYDLIHNSFGKYKDNIAIICGNEKISYGTLEKKVNRITKALYNLKIKSGSKIAVCVSGRLNYILCMLSILKAGCVCIPVDSSYSSDTILYMLTESAAYLFIYQDADVIDSLGYNIGTVCVGFSELAEYDGISDTKPVEINQDSPAFIIFTSGSTGKRKGVVLSHRGIISHIYSKINLLSLNESDKICQNLNINFVASIWQILASLIVGCELYVYAEQTLLNCYELMQNVSKDSISILELIPVSLCQYLSLLDSGYGKADLSRLRYLILTGESIRSNSINQFYKYHDVQLINAYGQTECSDDVLHYIIPRYLRYEYMALGKVYGNNEIYILDGNLRRQPVGAVGEIYVAGDCLSLGYISKGKIVSNLVSNLSLIHIYKDYFK